MTVLCAHAVSVTLGGAGILAEVDFAARAGEVVGLIGPNGAGKTTLLRAMAGLLSPDAGEIAFDGRDLRRLDRRDLARNVAYLAQDAGSHWPLTVEALVTIGRLPCMGRWQGVGDTDRAAVADALDACDVGHLADRSVTTLSGGERARVLLARALAVRPKVLLADEPVAGLDPAHQLDVMHLMRKLAASGAGVVVVMHDLMLAARFCDRLALLHDRRIAAGGKPEDVLSPGILERCYGIRAHHGLVNGEILVVPLERTTAGAGYASK